MHAKRQPRHADGAPFLLVAILLLALSLLPGEWVATGHADTVPRETPTRLTTPAPTATPSQTAAVIMTPTSTQAPLPSATAVPTQPAVQPTIAPASPAATLTAVPALPAVTATIAPAAPPTQGLSRPGASPTSLLPTSVPPPPSLTPGPPPSVQPLLPALSPTPAPPAATAQPGKTCGGAQDALNEASSDSRMRVHIPAGAVATPICIYVEPAQTSMPPAPEGYRFGSLVMRLRATDGTGGGLPGLTFGRPVSLSVRFASEDVASSPADKLSVAILGETSSDWAILETASDAALGTLAVSARQPGVFAILVRQAAARAAPAAEERSQAGDVGAAAALLVLLLVIGAALFLRRKRPA